MFISQTMDYAMRSLVTLARSSKPVTITELAKLTFVSRPYLAKTLQQLTHAGFIRSLRGKFGGFELAMPPAEISLHDVMLVIDPIQRITHCPLHLPEHAGKLCPMHQALDDSLATIECKLRVTTLAQLVEEGGLDLPEKMPAARAKSAKTRGRPRQK